MLLSDLGLSKKAFDALKACGVNKVEDILVLPKSTLMARPKVGPLTIKKIEFALRRHGFEWIDKTVDEPPLTIRDKFAMAALTGILAHSGTYYSDNMNKYPEQAYELADAMMAERKK